MIERIDAAKRYLASHDWLSTYHLFSFADYFDPANMNFGVLRVFNDDTIDAHNGFGMHGHRDMEIVTIMLEGELTHTDSMGNSRTIRKGDVQYMSAGSGVMHSEYNHGDEPVHLYQIWLLPRHKNTTPKYGEKQFGEVEKNKFIAVASGDSADGSLAIDSDATLYICDIEAGQKVSQTVSPGRGVFVYVQEGSVMINGESFSAGDQARITSESQLLFSTNDACKCVVIEVGM